MIKVSPRYRHVEPLTERGIIAVYRFLPGCEADASRAIARDYYRGWLTEPEADLLLDCVKRFERKVRKRSIVEWFVEAICGGK